MPKYQKVSDNPNYGAPRKEIDFALFEDFCKIQCTLSEIAGFFKVSEDTIETRCKEKYGVTFSDAFKIYSADGKMSLRRTQFRMAETNPAMCIWLGKQHLSQREPQYIEQVLTANVTGNLNLKALSNEELETLNNLIKKTNQAKSE